MLMSGKSLSIMAVGSYGSKAEARRDSSNRPRPKSISSQFADRGFKVDMGRISLSE